MKSCSNLITRASMWATLPLMVKKRGWSCLPSPSYSTNMRVVSSMTDPVLRWPQTRTSATRFSVVRRETKFSSCSFCSLSLRTSSAFFASSDHLCSYCHISPPPPATRAQTVRILKSWAFIFYCVYRPPRVGCVRPDNRSWFIQHARTHEGCVGPELGHCLLAGGDHGDAVSFVEAAQVSAVDGEVVERRVSFEADAVFDHDGADGLAVEGVGFGRFDVDVALDQFSLAADPDEEEIGFGFAERDEARQHGADGLGDVKWREFAGDGRGRGFVGLGDVGMIALGGAQLGGLGVAVAFAVLGIDDALEALLALAEFAGAGAGLVLFDGVDGHPGFFGALEIQRSEHFRSDLHAQSGLRRGFG